MNESLQLEKQSGFHDALLCPRCGFNYLHQKAVNVYERQEDADTGLHVRVTRVSAVIDQDLSGNPSPRRHAVTVTFLCEGCGLRSSLQIFQHKGVSHVSWSACERG